MWIGSIVFAILGIVAQLAHDHAHKSGLLAAFRYFRRAESVPILTGIERSRNLNDLYQVLRQKEMDIERVRKEIEALQFVIPMLADDGIGRPSPGSALPSRRAGTDDGLAGEQPKRLAAAGEQHQRAA